MAFHQFILFASLLSIVTSQVPIPKRKLGYIFGDVKGLTPVNVDAFLGPVCPDSKEVFPTLLQLANHYGTEVFTLRMHMFPLPYHRNSFLVAMVRMCSNFIWSLFSYSLNRLFKFWWYSNIFVWYINFSKKDYSFKWNNSILQICAGGPSGE